MNELMFKIFGIYAVNIISPSKRSVIAISYKKTSCSCMTSMTSLYPLEIETRH